MSRRTHRAGRLRGAGWAVAPSAVVTFIFVYGFIAYSLWISLSMWRRPAARDLAIRQPFAQTYAELFGEMRFQADLRNMVVFTVFFLALSIVGGLALAILVSHQRRGGSFLRAVFLLPYALAFIVTGVAFRWIFNPTTGFNTVLTALGWDNPPAWSADPSVIASIAGPGGWLQVQLGIPVALIPVVLAASWQLSGFAMAMYLAGIASIPPDELEAGAMDGAGKVRILRHIVLPQLWPVTLTCVVLLGHVSLKMFDLVVAMSGSGPGFATDVPGIYVFDAMTKAARYDKGTAAALVIFAIACAVVVPYLHRTYRRERSAT